MGTNLVAKRKKQIIWTAVMFTIVQSVFAFRGYPLLPEISMLAGCFWLAALILAIIYPVRAWKSERGRSLVPMAIIVGAFAFTTMVPRLVRDTYFKYKIPDLTEVIESYRDTGQLSETNWLGYDEPTVSLTPDSSTMVAFGWDSGFPLRGHDLVFCNTDDPHDVLRESGWRGGYTLQENWYIMSR